MLVATAIQVAKINIFKTKIVKKLIDEDNANNKEKNIIDKLNTNEG